MAAPPVPETRLRQITTDACDSALSSAEGYIHDSTEEWNNAIINSILKSLISESKPAEAKQTSFKFAVNSTIIQHSTDPRPKGTDPESAQDKQVGRRGMHSAAGAYWNNEKDGMWSFKYEGAESKGMDIVIMIIWVAA